MSSVNPDSKAGRATADGKKTARSEDPTKPGSGVSDFITIHHSELGLETTAPRSSCTVKGGFFSKGWEEGALDA